MLNGDPTVSIALTERGRAQAVALGQATGLIDLVAHTEFGRTRETAELAWPDAPTLVVPELNEIAFGRFEGTLWTDGYDTWTVTAGPEDECPGGGESRVAAVRRYLRGYRRVLERPEERVALIAHGAQVRYLLLALEGSGPAPRLEPVEPASAFTLTADELGSAIGVLAAWAASPLFKAH